MPWQEQSVMSEREAFVQAASEPAANRRALCRRFGISPQTGYRWLARVQAGGALADRSRRPRSSPYQTPPEMELMVLALRAEHPAWGGRKISRRLRDLGVAGVPSPSTVTAVLRRHGLLDGPGAGEPRAFVRFEHERPNDLWQMDFKGHVACGAGRCHPLTVLDDHSRYSVALRACADERTATVRDALEGAFREHGLPARIAVDNGAPWGNGPGDRYTPLVVWMLRLGVPVSHSRPYHPQTLGKEERFHRTLKAEVLGTPLADLASAQVRFDGWRAVYNHERPHEALADAVPATRYRPSERPYPTVLPPIEYPPGDLVRQVQSGGEVSLLGRRVHVPKAFRGYPVAFQPSREEGHYAVVFGTVQIAEVDLTVAPRLNS
ncbi:MAG: IS481 family transposase [Dehalococcoidia bacterium]